MTTDPIRVQRVSITMEEFDRLVGLAEVNCALVTENLALRDQIQGLKAQLSPRLPMAFKKQIPVARKR